MRKTLALIIFCLWFVTLCVQLLILRDVEVGKGWTKIIDVNEKFVLDDELTKVNYLTTNNLQNAPKQVTNDATIVINKFKRRTDKLIVFNNFTYKVNSQVCENKELQVVAIIMSASYNFHKRQIIRDTWGDSADYLKHVFLLGETSNFNEQILLEHKQYGDIVQGNFIDAYRNLTYKHIMGLKWASQYCANAKFVLKIDDDVFLNVYELEALVEKRLSRENDLISCWIHNTMFVDRNEFSKWYVSEQEFAGNRFPVYCTGYMIVYSSEVVEQLVAASENERYIFIDDVFVTGILREKLNVVLTEIKDLFLTRKKMNDVLQNGIEDVGRFLVGPKNVDVDEMISLWNITEESRKLEEKRMFYLFND